jgi:hypothetical protein
MCPSIMEARLRSEGRRKMRPEYVPERSRSTGREPTVAQVSGVHGLVLLSAAAAAAAAPGRGGVAVTCVHAVLGMGRGRGLGRSITVPNSSLGTSGTLVWEVFEGCNPPLFGQLGKVFPTSDIFLFEGLSPTPPQFQSTRSLAYQPMLIMCSKTVFQPPPYSGNRARFSQPQLFFCSKGFLQPLLIFNPRASNSQGLIHSQLAFLYRLVR